MEFRYRITEAEYLRARNLAQCLGCRARRRLLIVLSAVLVVAVAIGVTAFVTDRKHPGRQNHGQPSDHSSTPVGSFAAVAAAAAAITAKRTRMRYRQDPTLQGELRATLTDVSIAVRAADGSEWESSWGRFTGWREDRKRGLVVLREPGKQFVPLGVGSLDEAQRAEMRALLGRVLPTDCKQPG